MVQAATGTHFQGYDGSRGAARVLQQVFEGR